MDDDQRYGQLQERLENAYDGIIQHILVGIHHRIVRHIDNRQESAENQAEIHHFRSEHTVRFDVEDSVEERVHSRQEKDHRDAGYREMEHQADIEDLPFLSHLSLAFGIRHKALCGIGQGAVEKAQHSDGAADNVEHSEI